jgi:hypothetical protein
MSSMGAEGEADMAGSFDPRSVVVKRPSRWRWVKRILWSLFTLFIVIGVSEAYRHYQVSKKFADAVAELDRADPGWRLQDIENARAVIPDEENSALVSTKATDLLPGAWPLREVEEGLIGLQPEVMLDDEQVRLLGGELKEREQSLRIALQLAHMPNGRHPIEYKKNPIQTLLNSQDKTRRTAALLRYPAFVRAQENDMHAAMIACRAIINAGRSLGDEPLLISQIIRIANVTTGYLSTERVLAQGEPNPEDLLELQRLLETEDAHPTRRIMLRGERGMQHAIFTAVESGDVSLDEFSGNSPGSVSWTELLLGWRVRDNFRAEHPVMLDLMNQMVDTDRLPLPEQSAAEGEILVRVKNLPKSVSLTRLMFPALDRGSDSCWRKHANGRCLIVILALERYRQAHGDWPASLEKLVPKLLSAVPLDPYDGEPLRYRRLDDGVIVYSVGSDREDNGGTLDRQNPTRRGADLGYRLWDVKHRRQPPPPKPKPVEPPGDM